MILLKSLHFSPQEQKLLKRVFLISMVLFLLAIILTWAFQQIAIKRAVNEIALKKRLESDISDVFIKKSNNLLPIDINAHKFAAEQYENNINTDEAIKHLLRILSVEKNNRKIKLKLATLYYKNSEYQKAENIFKELINENIKDSLTESIMARYGLTLFLNGKIDQSIAHLDNTIKQFPASAESYCYRGQVESFRSNVSKKAEEYFKKSLEINPDYTETLYQFARYYMNNPDAVKEDYINARIYLIKQSQIEPLNPKVHSRLGMIYYYLNKPDIAKKYYKTALALNENDYNTHYNLGELYYSAYNNQKKALEEFKKTIQIKNTHAKANFKIGLISLENNMYKEAIQYLKKAREYAPNNIRILLQLGVAYEKINLISEAESVYNSILDLDALNDIAIQKLKVLSSGK